MTTINNSEEWGEFLEKGTLTDLSFQHNEEEVTIGNITLEYPFSNEDVEDAIEDMNSDYYIDEFDSLVYEDLTDFT